MVSKNKKRLKAQKRKVVECEEINVIEVPSRKPRLDGNNGTPLAGKENGTNAKESQCFSIEKFELWPQ
ncbi:unnamed protein product [Strongylus vulgaris]|uniref:Uncharacterized protein n=1 Tax=Strongylus vulgaris TaxID=40348 RepID=A0A3P7JSL5_STRVU|nr:unnamed protein product [Strongylus vulgaris]